MNTFEFVGGKVRAGITLQKDNRFGNIVYLGEAGRGRRFERISLDKFNPAEVREGRVHNASLKKITLPPRNGKGEFTFFVLEKSNILSKVLVRINTQGVYTRGSYGSWTIVQGNPEKIIGGYGARGTAGRIGGWSDDLVEMKDGDLIKVKVEGGHKTKSYALWVSDSEVCSSSWQDYESLQKVERTKSFVSKLEESLDDLTFEYEMMPAATWARGKITSGITLNTGEASCFVRLGEDGRGRSYVDIPFIANEGKFDSIDGASLIRLEDETNPYVLAGIGTRLESDALLLRVQTSWVYTRGTNGYVEIWRGNPKIIAKGKFAHGAAGRIGTAEDVLLVMHEGDVLFVHPEGGYKTDAFACYVQVGKIETMEWRQWKMKDGQDHPEFYIEKGTAPKGHVPKSWIGRVVKAERYVSAYLQESAYMDDIATGELISVDPPVLNLGWDGTDYRTQSVGDADWVRLEVDKKVVQIDADMQEQRDTLKKKARELLEEVQSIPVEFLVDDRSLQCEVENLSEYGDDELATMPTDGDGSLTYFVRRLEHVLKRYNEVKENIEEAVTRQERGEILTNFEASRRMGGKTGNGNGWVIQPDGQLRAHDEDTIPRFKSDGTLIWHTVHEDELALQWRCSHTGDRLANSEFEVVKKPVGGCTEAQLERVAIIEEEHLSVPVGSFGLHEDLKKEQDSLLERARDAMNDLMRVIPDFTYNELISQNGVLLYSENGLRCNCIRGVSDLGADAREARRLELVELDCGGFLEVITYFKYGDDNYAIRFRENVSS